MENAKAFAILREHAGSQWDPWVVDAVIALAGISPVCQPAALDGVGRVHAHRRREPCECLDALPADVREQLQTAGSVN